MADYLSRACKLQLTTAMENLVRTAVCEISQIFEDSLHDHQMELARKGEEIAHLKVKLQRAELMLREVPVGSGSDQVSNPSREGPGASDEDAVQTTNHHEFEYQVPDDWCVPLDSENVNKQENVCPSVRLRQFSITLSPIPLRHEAFRNLEVSRLRSQQKNSTQRGLQEEMPHKRKRGRPRSSGNDKVKEVLVNIQAETPHRRTHGRRSLSKNDNVKDVLMRIKEESLDSHAKPLTQKAVRKAKERHVRSTNMKTQSNSSANVYHCRICPKVFDTSVGLKVHVHAHRKCKGCKRIFPLQSVLVQHKKTCKSYRKLMNLSTITSKKTVCKEPSSTKQKDKSVHITASSIRKRNRFTCKCCMEKYSTRSDLMKHPCFISCQTCNKRLSSQIALAVHTEKVHKSLGNVMEKKMGASLTNPLIKMEKSHGKNVREKAQGHVKQCPHGYKCLTCKKVYLSKYVAIEHINVHTGERPFKCAVCSQTFSNRNSLSMHRRQEHGVIIRKRIKCACSKSFFSKSKYKEHAISCRNAGQRKKVTCSQLKK